VEESSSEAFQGVLCNIICHSWDRYKVLGQWEQQPGSSLALVPYQNILEVGVRKNVGSLSKSSHCSPPQVGPTGLWKEKCAIPGLSPGSGAVLVASMEEPACVVRVRCWDTSAITFIQIPTPPLTGCVVLSSYFSELQFLPLLYKNNTSMAV
jgi:hypothetical protein